MRTLLRIAAAPLLLAAAGTAAALAIAWGWNREALLAGMLLFTLAYLTLLEFLIPLEPSWQVRREDVWPDLAHLVLVNAFSGIGAVAALSLALWLQQSAGLEWALWREVPIALQAAAAMIVGEFLPYWYHRLSHGKRPFLWRVHAIHHITPRLNSLKSSWMHPLNTFANGFAKMLPILALGFSAETLAVVAVFSLVIGYMSHANIDARTGPLDYLIATPHVHRFHHSLRPEEARNYGTNVMLWDLLFGTYFNAPHRVGEIGVRPRAGHDYPPLGSVAHQLRFPFRRGREPAARP
ncbi:MAG TPA: sterol desaturase family protein [Allosphingosinicella sp.]|jgi:sterol desaturase/sphingolipid hydroxylase (fatty acid hydroxylase superfamily)|nr:sterol desaturase family protein [Allosphingosinicella sp.]